MSFRRGLVGMVSAAAVCAAGCGNPSNVKPASPEARGKMTTPTKVTSVEGITEYKLGNGMKVLLFPDPSRPTVTVNVTYRVGSRFEGYGETGMAHLLEHMVFKGTDKHPKIWKEMQDHGAQFNGTTSFDRTNYFETTPATDENLEWSLGLEADRMVNSHIAKSDLDSEFSVVRNEFEMGENSPDRVLEERVMSTAYLWHNYGKSTIGSREDIERVPINRLKAFYQKYYQPDNSMLVVAGKFDEAKTLRRINELFGSIPRPSRVLDPTYTVEPVQDGERSVTLRRVGDIQAIIAMYHICAATHPDIAAIAVLNDIMDATQTGRLYKALVETQMATRVGADAEQLFDPGVIEFNAEVAKDKPLQPVQDKLLEIVEGLGKQDITGEEVDRAKNSFQKHFDEEIADTTRVAVGLTNWESRGDWRLMFLNRDWMKNVTPADVKRVAALYLKPSNRTLGVFMPTKEIERTKVPTAPDIAMLLKDYKGQAAVAQGEAFDATPANIESRTQRGTLSTGVKTALLPKKTRGQRVVVDLTLHYGSETTLKHREDAAGFVAAMLDRGTTKHTRRQMEDELDKLKATVRIGAAGGASSRAGRMLGMGGGGAGALSVSIDTVRENLPATIALVGEMLREPAFPQTEFDKLKKQSLSGIERGKSEPTLQAMNALQRKLSPYSSDDVRYVPTIAEQIDRLKAVTLDDVKAVYKDLIGASYGELTAVGDFDPKELTGAFNKVLDGWATPKPYERIAMPYHAPTADQLTIDTPDKQMAVVLVGSTLEIKDDDADFPALQMANMILGQGGNSRLINRLRQKEGYSYTVMSMISPKSEDRSAGMIIFANANPQTVTPCSKAAREELDRFLKDGVTAKELADAKEGFKKQVAVQMSNDGMVATMLSRQCHLGRTMKFTEQQIARTEALTVDQVNAAARKYINTDQIVSIRAGDMNAKRPEPTADKAEKADN